ncbi:MAG: rhamnulokinase family protein [SAR324 cluster bacterium]|nr:rhamnulokinase family protein [SAR324 cluster bacterium]
MRGKTVLAVDLGGESGRVMMLEFNGSKFYLEEIHRFANLPVEAAGTLFWNVLSLWREMQIGIAKSPSVDSIGVDSWGVDFALLDRHGKLLGNPLHYRDSCTEGMKEWVFERVPQKELFKRTGNQSNLLNGLYQLAHLVKTQSPMLEACDTFVTIADLFNYWLSGNKFCEYTHATTQQLYNPTKSEWDYETMEALEIPKQIFPKVQKPGTQIGKYHQIPVILPACHDTASAVVAVPSNTQDHAFLSSGTWSLLGLELEELILSDQALEANLTNEGGFGGTNRFLQNIAGLWLVQQSVKTWSEEGRTYNYDQTVAMAESATPFQAFIDPDLPQFLPAGDMPSRIKDYCQNSGQEVPQTPEELLRVIYESLAMKYRYFLNLLVKVSGKEVKKLHVLGGGSRNRLLNQFCANAMQIPVVAGPTEATSIGNAMVQLIALGEIGNLQEAREIIVGSSALDYFEPQHGELWNEQFERYKKEIIGKNESFKA